MPLTRAEAMPEGERGDVMTGHQYINATTPVRGPMGEKKAMTPADVIYRIATVTAVISLLATVL
jgi:hypothetical protein